MGNRHVKRGGRKIVSEYLTKLCSWSMSQYLPTGDFNENVFTKKHGAAKSFFVSGQPNNEIKNIQNKLDNSK